MSKGSKRFALLIEILVTAVWYICVLLFRSPASIYLFSKITLIPGTWYWCGILGELLAATLTIISTGMSRMPQSRSAVEVNAVPFVFTMIYFFGMMAINTLFVIISNAMLRAIPVAITLFSAIIYLTLWFGSAKAAERADKTTIRAAEKIRNTNEISSRLDALLAMVKDPQIYNEIHSLKEEVDFSSNISTNYSAPFENEFIRQIDETEHLININAENKMILESVERAERTWRMRNSGH